MQSEFRKGWKPLGAATIGVACGASPIPFNVAPIVLGPIQQEFGWSFVEVSAGITFYGIIGALMAPFFGGLVDRHGVKKVALGSLAAFGFSFALLGLVPNLLFAYFAMWALIGLVGIGSTPVTWSRAINMWFFKRRGLALGILLLGTSLAAFVVPQVGNLVNEAYGWRAVFPVIALLPLLVAIPIAMVFFREPKPEEMPDEVGASGAALPGFTLPEAARSVRFWLLFGSVVAIALAYGGAHIHMFQIVQLKGFTAATAATMLSIVAVGIMSGRILVGMLFDKFWAPGIACAVLLLPVAACLMLVGDISLPMLSFAAFLLGFAAGAEADIIAFMAARYFGMREYGRIYGTLYMPFGIFASISPLLYGYVRDTTGSYDLMLQFAAVLFLIGAVLLVGMGRYPDLTQETPAAEPNLARS